MMRTVSASKEKFTASIPTQVLFDANLPNCAKVTLAAIYALSNQSGFSPVHASEISHRTGQGVTTVRRHIRALEDAGYIVRGHRYEHPRGPSPCPRPGCYGIQLMYKSSGVPSAPRGGLKLGWKYERARDLS